MQRSKLRNPDITPVCRRSGSQIPDCGQNDILEIQSVSVVNMLGFLEYDNFWVIKHGKVFVGSPVVNLQLVIDN